MRAHPRHLRGLLPLVLLVSAAAWAQTPPASAPGAPLTREEMPAERGAQRAERIVTEDAGSRVEEVRIGGQTQSITVQPKVDVPAYEVRPVDGSRSAPALQGGNREGSSGGSRVWNIRQF